MKTLLAYVHPIFQILALLVVFAALRLGLALKKQRTQKRYIQNQHEVFIRHTQLGLIAVLCLLGGYGLGLISMPWLRDKAPFGSAHFFFSTITLLLFLGAPIHWMEAQKRNPALCRCP